MGPARLEIKLGFYRLLGEGAQTHVSAPTERSKKASLTDLLQGLGIITVFV